jgi:hypothetical protein
MDDPGLIFFEEVSSDALYVQCSFDQNFTDKICVEHDLDNRAWTRQIINSGHV